MKRLVFFLFCALSSTALAQSPYIVSVEILPQNPTTNDELFLATHVATGNQGQYLGSIVNLMGNDVSVESCYFEGMLTQPQEYYDTISLGYLAAGNYNLDYTAYLSLIYNDCDYQDTNNLTTSFIVSQAASLNDLEAELVRIYPNPSPSGEFYVESPSLIASFALVDLQGNSISLQFSRTGNTYQISPAAFSRGTYLLEISFDSGNKIRKRIMY